MLSQLGITPKIAPAYDGTTSWFEYEQLIDDWCDITTLDESKRGPSLKTRLTGLAAVQKESLDRTKLAAQDGVDYFKRKMRPFFVKGEQYVFLRRFLGLFKAWKGNQDFVTWIAKFEIVLQRLRNSWMDLLPEVNLEDRNPEFLAAVQADPTFRTIQERTVCRTPL